MKSKKGFGLQYYFLIIAFFAGLVTFFYFRLTSKQVDVDFVGQNALLILGASQKGLNALSYLQKSGEYSLEQSVYDLATHGGIRQSECGRINGFNVWVEIEKQGDNIFVKECYPDDKKIEESFKLYFDEEIKSYAAGYSDANIPLNFQYLISEEPNLKLIATSEEYIELGIAEEVVDSVGEDVEITDVSSPLRGLGIPMKSRVDIETIQELHPEVLEKYRQLCNEMGYAPSGVCAGDRKKCCVTSGYRKGAGYHGLAYALDINVGEVSEQIRWAEAADKVGFTGIFVYPCDKDPHLHVDLRPKSHCLPIRKCFPNGKMIANARRSATLSCKGDNINKLKQCGWKCG